MGFGSGLGNVAFPSLCTMGNGYLRCFFEVIDSISGCVKVWSGMMSVGFAKGNNP